MFSRVFLGVGLTFVLCVFPAALFAQAAVEYGAIAGCSASMTVEAGTAFQPGVSRLAGHVGRAMPRPAETVAGSGGRKQEAKGQTTHATRHTDPAQWAPNTSKGGEAGCDRNTIKNSDLQLDKRLKPTNCQHAKPNHRPQNKYPSAVTVSFRH
jgi:hypothetical protein